LVLGLGCLDRAPTADVTIDHDPRVEETELARQIRYIDQSGAHIVWLDPDRPSDLKAHLRTLDGPLPAVKGLAIVVRADDMTTCLELNERTMTHRADIGSTIFLRASRRFSRLEEWLAYGRALSTERPSDLWLRIRCGKSECLVSEGTAATVGGWFAHVLRVYEPGIPGRLSQLGLVASNAGITLAMLARSTEVIANGLRFG
jgi:hypothetical protein